MHCGSGGHWGKFKGVVHDSGKNVIMKLCKLSSLYSGRGVHFAAQKAYGDNGAFSWDPKIISHACSLYSLKGYSTV